MLCEGIGEQGSVGHELVLLFGSHSFGGLHLPLSNMLARSLLTVGAFPSVLHGVLSTSYFSSISSIVCIAAL